ncbi:hypothetical protein Ptr902_02281 [Pyrenophora tritici-repentis]|nr:hypothetical protein Ptr902_02281 [Pyrenophora tritici-repentis]
MSSQSPLERSRRLPKKPRLSGPWPFIDEITSRICRHAGREASAALCVALYKNKADDKNSSDGHGASDALQAVYYEPSTYWDWHTIHPDDDSAFNEKRQLLWERQRGFRHHGIKEGYPSPRQAWIRFRSLILAFPEKIPWVEKIAVAHWMTVEDVEWIFSTLTSVVALDLSDVPHLPKNTNDHVSSTYPNAITRSTDDVWPLCIWTHSATDSFLKKLSWLGLPNFCDGTSAAPMIMVERLLPCCTSLRTLSIRGNYELETPTGYMGPSGYKNYFQNTFLGHIPVSVSSLELRFSYDRLNELLDSIHVKIGSGISRVGIDLGAWIQMYPFSDQTQSHSSRELSDEDVISTARLAAQKSFRDIYDKVQEKHPGLASRLPEIHTHAPPSNRDEAKSLYKRDFYSKPGGSGLYRGSINTVMAMLRFVYTTGLKAEENGIHLESLQPEWQAKSTNPIHPLAMTENKPHENTSTKNSSGNVNDPLVGIQELYAWLNEVFNWRPIFDWDCFLRTDSDSVDDNNNNNPIAEIAKHFQYLREARILVHVILGRRPPGQSSLYWGWPYNADEWETSLTTPFDTGLKPVAAYIDTLSIFYDLRNPLDQNCLEVIEMRQPYEGPDASCPRPVCPWGDNNDCPFQLQWNSRPPCATKLNAQNTANKQPIAKMCYLPLASNLPPYPPTGEYRSDHPEANCAASETLHQLSIRAANDREALGWQRFWAACAPRLTNLTELNVRMPVSFDKVRSWRLAKLINPRFNWEMSRYADEQGHLQTRQDLEYHAGPVQAHAHSSQQKMWPVGRFVRRTWVS